jgi:polar amino acid transport system substrate-binding protein
MLKRCAFALLGILVFAGGLSAQALTVVIPQVSPAAIDTYTKIITAIAEVEGKTANVQVLPFARAIYMMETKQADIEAVNVQIPDQSKWATLKYDYSTTALAKIAFVLYSNKAKPITAAELKAGNAKGYKLETDSAHVDHFNFAISPSTNIDGSLKKVDSGQIDGFIFAMGSTDAALKRLGFKNISRQSYDTFNGVFLLQKGARGGPVDAMITDGIARLKANGKFQEIMGPYMAASSTFIEWQP